VGQDGIPLVERAAEIAAIDAALARGRRDGVVVLLSGVAGIGKSRLLAAAVERARGFEVLHARGGLLERDLALGVVRQLLEGPLAATPEGERRLLLAGPARPAGHILGFQPPEGPQSRTDLASRLHALYWLIYGLAKRGPLLLAVDDLHWADRGSVEFLLYLARRLDGLPVLVLGAVREGEPHDHEEAIAELSADATVIRPGPLSRAGVADVVSEAVGRPVADDLVSACHTATAGNPFFLRELLAALELPAGAANPIPAEAIRAAGPATVARSILLRLGRLGPAPAKLAMAAALMGEGMPLRHAATLADMDLAEAERSADVLVAARILAGVHPLRFEHPIVAAAIVEDLLPARRAADHRRAATLLREAGEPAERIVPHLLSSAPAGDARAVEVLRDAASAAAARGAPDVAARLLRRALDEPPPEGRFALLAELAGDELLAGEWAACARTSREAIEAAPDAPTRARMRQLQAYATLSVEGAPAALRCLERGAEEAREADSQLALLLEGELATQSWFAGVPYPRLDRLGDPAELSGKTHPERVALAVLALDALRRDEPAGVARDLALRALDDGRLLAEELDTLAFYLAVCALLEAEAFEEARGAIDSAWRLVTAAGSAWGFAGISWVRGLLTARVGPLSLAEAEERHCIEHAVPTMRGIGHSALALVLLEQGDVTGAGAELERGGLLGDERPLFVWGPYVRGLVRLADGQPVAALHDFEEVGRHASRVGGAACALPWRADAARALHALGRAAEAEPLAAEEVERARRRGTSRALGIALRAQGLVASGPRRLELLGEAVEALESSPARLDFARAGCDYGTGLLRAGKRAAGRDLLQRSHKIATDCGARGLAAVAAEELRIVGAPPRAAVAGGASSLTASERRVAEMAARRLTNNEIAQALFVTPKTVENHLGRVYVKLGVSSRREIASTLGLDNAD